MGANFVNGKFELTGWDTIYERFLHPKQKVFDPSKGLSNAFAVVEIMAVVGMVLAGIAIASGADVHGAPMVLGGAFKDTLLGML
jgi:hypothetical protein